MSLYCWWKLLRRPCGATYHGSYIENRQSLVYPVPFLWPMVWVRGTPPWLYKFRNSQWWKIFLNCLCGRHGFLNISVLWGRAVFGSVAWDYSQCTAGISMVSVPFSIFYLLGHFRRTWIKLIYACWLSSGKLL